MVAQYVHQTESRVVGTGYSKANDVFLRHTHCIYPDLAVKMGH